ncbi:MAG: phosphate ABC transporter substrate-binding protein [Actinobacteria bacterium]|nr:phosphate ABC transporter substrate-binding protein [Actinomycetota bacterium]
MKKNIFYFLATILVFSLLFVGCGKQNASVKETSLKIAGSTSVFPLITEVAEEFKKENTQYNVEVQAGGSNVGIQSVLSGAVQIGMSSRDLTEDELKSGLKPTTIAYDCIVVIVNPKNKIDNLSLEQIRDIYTGKIKNWKELGGKDSKIIVVNRDEASGTREAFKKLVLGDSDFVDTAIIQPGTGQVKSFVSSNEDAIGYISFGVVDSTVKVVKVDNIEPSIENIKNGSYKITRKLYLLTKGEPEGLSKEFIDYVLSDRIQETIVKKHYIPVKYIENR